MKYLYYCTVIPLIAVSVSNRLQLLHCPDNASVATATEECSTGRFWPSVLSPVSPTPDAVLTLCLRPVSPTSDVFDPLFWAQFPLHQMLFWPSVLSPVFPTSDVVLTLCFEPSLPYTICFLTLCLEPGAPYTRCCFDPLFWTQFHLHCNILPF